MRRHVTVPGAATSRSGGTVGRHQSANPIRKHERPETALEQLFKTWIEAGLPRSFGLPCVWLRRLRDRHELAGLTPAQLRDVGLDPGLVQREMKKPFWMG